MSFTSLICALLSKPENSSSERYEQPLGSQYCPSGRNIRADSDSVDSPRITCTVDPSAKPTVTNTESPGQSAAGRWVSMSSSMVPTLNRIVSVSVLPVSATSSYHPVSVTSTVRVVSPVLHHQPSAVSAVSRSVSMPHSGRSPSTLAKKRGVCTVSDLSHSVSAVSSSATMVNV